MWRNFAGRTDEEIREAREYWMTSDRFGEVKGYGGAGLGAPEVPPTPLKARGRDGDDVPRGRGAKVAAAEGPGAVGPVKKSSRRAEACRVRPWRWPAVDVLRHPPRAGP
ncbi:hypothetical protein [Streptomyces sp. NPDC003863]